MKGLYDCRRCSLSHEDCECVYDDFRATIVDLKDFIKVLRDENDSLRAVVAAARGCKLARESGFSALWNIPLAADRLEAALAALDAFKESGKGHVQPDDDV